MAIEVQKREYGVFIVDECCEGIAVTTEEIPKLIRDLQEQLPWNFNEVAFLPLT